MHMQTFSIRVNMQLSKQMARTKKHTHTIFNQIKITRWIFQEKKPAPTYSYMNRNIILLLEITKFSERLNLTAYCYRLHGPSEIWLRFK